MGCEQRTRNQRLVGRAQDELAGKGLRKELRRAYGQGFWDSSRGARGHEFAAYEESSGELKVMSSYKGHATNGLLRKLAERTRGKSSERAH